MLTDPDETVLQPFLDEIEEIGWTNKSPEIRRVLAGFVNHYQEFRTYLAYPNLRLPTTNNTAETLIGLVEDVTRRSRGFKKVKTFTEWITCVVKTRKTIRCSPHINRLNQS